MQLHRSIYLYAEEPGVSPERRSPVAIRSCGQVGFDTQIAFPVMGMYYDREISKDVTILSEQLVLVFDVPAHMPRIMSKSSH
jgi:hypothetical protein